MAWAFFSCESGTALHFLTVREEKKTFGVKTDGSGQRSSFDQTIVPKPGLFSGEIPRTQLCSECSATPSASASRPSRTPRCPQIVSLGGANHRPWMRRGRTSARTRRFTVSRCGAASVAFGTQNRTGHLRFAITRDAFPVASRNPRQSRGFGQPRLPTLVCSRPPVPRSPRDAAKSAVPWLARRRCVTTPSLPTTVR